MVGSDEAEARFYEVSLSWAADALDAARELHSAVIDITELSAEAFGALVEHEREAENG